MEPQQTPAVWATSVAEYSSKPANEYIPYCFKSTEKDVKYLVNEPEKDISFQDSSKAINMIYHISLENWLLEKNTTTVRI